VFGLSADDICLVPGMEEWLQERQLVTDLIKQHLNMAALCMKHQADKGRSERQFEVGDKVFMKLQPYVQSLVANRANQKLSFKFFGPFEIQQKVGSVAYKLSLPPSSIHLMFHVSQLKKAIGVQDSVSPLLPSEFSEFQVPEKILQRRMVAKSVHQVLQA
jgi:hypothetical protein